MVVTRHSGSESGNKNRPPPLWFWTDGRVTVGPVTTRLLVRDVLEERVTPDCLVRERSWKGWRHPDRIREIGALRRAQAEAGIADIDPARWSPLRPPLAFDKLDRDLKRAQDPGEVLLYSLTEAMAVTNACVGAVHRRRPPHVGLVTSCTSGPGMHRRLGHIVLASDPVLGLAARGGTLCEPPRYGTESALVSERLGALPACSGIAMVPVLCFGRLYAMLELGRPDHAFREGDFQAVLHVARRTAARLGIVRNWHQV